MWSCCSIHRHTHHCWSLLQIIGRRCISLSKLLSIFVPLYNIKSDGKMKKKRLLMHSLTFWITMYKGKGKGKERIAVNGTPSHSYGTSLAIWDHTVLPATRHKWTRPALPQPVSRYSIYLLRRDGRLNWPRLPGSAPTRSRTCDLSITSPTP